MLRLPTREAGFDVASMAATLPRSLILEGHGPACRLDYRPPAVWPAKAKASLRTYCYFPEVKFDQEKFLARVKQWRRKPTLLRDLACPKGSRTVEGKFLGPKRLTDAFAMRNWRWWRPTKSQTWVKDQLGLQVPLAVADYCNARHGTLPPSVDVEQAYAWVKAGSADGNWEARNA